MATKILKEKIKYEGTSFTRDFITGFDRADKFLEAMNDETHSAVLEGDPKREAKLRELYAIAQPKEEAAAPVEAEEAKPRRRAAQQ